ncbi:HepT-like ribonuclease domain-containing protein [Jiella marina]|uniref:HepT-like ribonuclease domain-containing protein n=1 Tax=Jiella sp. LLJ827 TaxID=2917712 RepID=UPI002100AAFB|nr:HepT-like ribonuclease domain-containing protein [Jiella sp. LLJ827]MCQ0990094.1 DUF86 domain-containing protein [Jiella sp. LLJ827]
MTDDPIDPVLLDLLVSLHEACLRCQRVAGRTSLEGVATDEFAQLAVSKAIEQVGEGAHRVLRKFPEFVAEHPEIEFRYAFLMRNRIAHGYDTLDWPTLWQIAVTSVPEFRKSLEPILKDAGEDLP